MSRNGLRARVAFALTGLALSLLLGTGTAAAQLDEEMEVPRRTFESAERMTLELHIGPYQPDMDNAAFDTFFADDDGLLLRMQLDVIAFRLPNILYLSGGGGFGWAQYKGRTLDTSGGRASEETELELLPLQLLAVLRFDALARQLGIPFILTGKLGYAWVHWATESGGSDTASGWSLGLAYAGQVALDLDSFDLAAARVMDEDWGINHTFLFFELFGIEPNGDSLPVGDLSWSAGLGFVF